MPPFATVTAAGPSSFAATSTGASSIVVVLPKTRSCAWARGMAATTSAAASAHVIGPMALRIDWPALRVAQSGRDRLARRAHARHQPAEETEHEGVAHALHQQRGR